MQILSLNEQPFFELPCRIIDSSKQIRIVSLPFLRGTVDRLPDGVEALVVTSDLQARELDENSNRLLGEVVAEELFLLADGETLPAPQQIGVILAGDLFVPPRLDARGGVGEVSHVWRGFAELFQWVIGVAGNHDDEIQLAGVNNAWELDGGIQEVGAWQFAGLGGIIGKPSRARRRSDDEYCKTLHTLLKSSPDFLILHQAPTVPGEKFSGDPSIRRVLEQYDDVLTICGHAHWKTPLAELSGGQQVLNVDDRVVVLTR